MFMVTKCGISDKIYIFPPCSWQKRQVSQNILPIVCPVDIRKRETTGYFLTRHWDIFRAGFLNKSETTAYFDVDVGIKTRYF